MDRILTRPKIARAAPALLVMAVVFAAAGAAMLALKLQRFLSGDGPYSMLPFLHGVTQAWLEGAPVYELHRSGVVLPPPSWPLLSPWLGWWSLDEAHRVWAGLTVTAVAALACAGAAAMPSRSYVRRLCVFVAPFSMPALAEAIGVGALTPVVLGAAVWAVLLAAHPESTRTRQAAAGGLYLLALADPAVALPFAAPLLVAPHGWRAAVIAAVGYMALTLAAAGLHPGDMTADFRGWIDHFVGRAGEGYGTLSRWLVAYGWQAALLAASVVLLAAHAAIVWWARRSDVWVLLGIAAVVARLWVAPRIESDALFVVPLIALAREAQRNHSRLAPWCAAALVVSGLVLWMPLQLHFPGSSLGPVAVSSAMVRVFDASHVLVAVAMLVTLMACAAARAVRTEIAEPTHHRLEPENPRI